ncbi:MAG: hypothetical protein A3G45_03315 [Candidatus Staskawiczbacteria bacterium RIFCSPLOWO2_12_FULL_37_15]|uniref:Uncharacterized protein n=1 Tax=Candidatus Staskawiczbacteria bacterium RIFCSPLOWO2_12_FULL_37_15 TaxID=1802218 RepID=A0A1G2ILC2_9BACT|nr:MAG: hypothetical protein A3G45_03315 [Candidatus Staskawiczbacteria bacterium RIFCSPLOWO2_12_FULL_37_15]
MLKYVLFWLYLWQLKEYHVGRFFDHFRTHKGKKLLFSFEQILKLVLLGLFVMDSGLFNPLFFVTFLVYLGESLIFLRNVYLRNFKKPIKTSKTMFLALASLAVVILFFGKTSNIEDKLQPVWLLVFDILAPLIISIVVLIFQPFFVFARNNILRKASKKIKGFKGLTVIGITGSYGKTTTKEFLTTILSKKFKVAGTKKHQNSEIGIAKCILNDLNSQHQIFVVEMGAYKKGGIKLLADIVKPKIGIVTGVNEQHLALFGSLENLLSAEGGGELAESLPKDGALIVNGDNKYCLDLLMHSSNLPANQEKKYSTSNKTIDSDIWTEEITVKKDSISLVAVDKNKNLANFTANVLGGHNVLNLLGAILVANELGMNFEEISDACKNIKQEQAGMILNQGKLGIDIIDSSYSANPDGVYADLNYLSIFPNKKAIIMPCLIELGLKSAEIHQKIGKKIGEICGLAIVTSKDKFEDMKKGAMEAGMKEKNILLCDNPQEIFSAITSFCKSGDVVLLEGRIPSKVIKLLTNE